MILLMLLMNCYKKKDNVKNRDKYLRSLDVSSENGIISLARGIIKEGTDPVIAFLLDTIIGVVEKNRGNNEVIKNFSAMMNHIREKQVGRNETLQYSFIIKHAPLAFIEALKNNEMLIFLMADLKRSASKNETSEGRKDFKMFFSRGESDKQLLSSVIDFLYENREDDKFNKIIADFIVKNINGQPAEADNILENNQYFKEKLDSLLAK